MYRVNTSITICYNSPIDWLRHADFNLFQGHQCSGAFNNFSNTVKNMFDLLQCAQPEVYINLPE